jgi:4-amino-4-deoxy-L-arabinose transferase-like glycosyltransferase
LYQGLRLSRLWLVVVIAAFCLPLLVGLGEPDLETDEAIYSFAVERILEIGDWLEPKSSPSETDAFLEKPPLKFWLVAAPIKAGLLPHDDFGLRFIDAVAGGAAFVYTFAIGALLAGPVCGAVAVLLLFIHDPLVFAHGLRTNNMEASLILSYAAGVFHFLRWSALDDVRRRRRHAMWAGLFFVLGFMTKFVAALFLPFTLGLAALVFSGYATG